MSAVPSTNWSRSFQSARTIPSSFGLDLDKFVDCCRFGKNNIEVKINSLLLHKSSHKAVSDGWVLPCSVVKPAMICPTC